MVRILVIGAVLLGIAPVLCQADAGQIERMCFEEAGNKYNIAPKLLKAIAQVESDFRINITNTKNRNKSTDYCHMQVNSWWKQKLGENWKYLNDPCYCTMVGAWILRQCIDRYGYGWDAVACYNTGKSTRTNNHKKKQLGQKYIKKVQVALISMEK